MIIKDPFTTQIKMIVTPSFRLSLRKGRGNFGRLGIKAAAELSEQASVCGG